MSIKADLMCKICNQILDDPIFLPCFCSSICQAHIGYLKSIRDFKCDICHEKINIPVEGFKPNKPFKNFIEKNGYLTEEEKKAKINLESLLKDVSHFLNEIGEKSREIETFNFDQFSNIKRDVERRREILKMKIDEIAADLVEKIEQIEEKHKQNEKKNQIICKELDPEKEKKFVNDLFRNPDVNFKTIEQYELKVKEFQGKLKEIQQKNEDVETCKFEFDFNLTDELFGAVKISSKKAANERKKSEHLLTCSLTSNEIHIWNLKNNTLTKKVINDSNGIVCFNVHEKTKLIIGDLDSSIKIFDLKTDKILKTLTGHSSSVFCLRLLDNNLLASGSADSSVMLWNVSKGLHIKTLAGHTNFVNCLEKLPNGYLASGSQDKLIKIWDVYAEKHVRVLKGHKDGVKCLKLLTSFKLASGSLDSNIIIWNYNTSECIQMINGHTSSVLGLEYISNDQLISCSTDNYLKVWNLSDNSYISALNGHTGSISCIRLSSDGLIYSGSDDKSLKCWNIQSGECLSTIKEIFEVEHLQLI
jgi:WD40 repeat protein